MKHGTTVNAKNLRRLCWKNDFHGIAGLARAIGRSRVTVHRAVVNPQRFGPTYELIKKALHV